MEQAEAVGGRKWVCEYHCGFGGTFAVVAKHERTCARNPALRNGNSTDTTPPDERDVAEWAVEEEEQFTTPSTEPDDGASFLSLYRMAGVEYLAGVGL